MTIDIEDRAYYTDFDMSGEPRLRGIGSDPLPDADNAAEGSIKNIRILYGCSKDAFWETGFSIRFFSIKTKPVTWYKMGK